MDKSTPRRAHHPFLGWVSCVFCCAALSASAQPEQVTEVATPDLQASETAEAMVIDLRNTVDQRAAPEPAPESSLVLEYRNAIATQERLGGAYAPGMTEQLLGLGAALQELNRHEEAIDVFKRGAHIARINSGLYSGEQIALLRSEIRSHLAMGQFDVVDERQRYLYRVERRALSSRSESAVALMRQAK